jgi:hypothetical protein
VLLEAFRGWATLSPAADRRRRTAARQCHAPAVLPRQPRPRQLHRVGGCLRARRAHETFGLVILEALACGRPVVAMRAGPCRAVRRTRRRARRAA